MHQHEPPADDPFRNRQPTSHEQMTGVPWDASYSYGPAPWDIGRPQPAIARLASEGAFTGTVLDAGCGTGEHSLLIASLGLPVLGIDLAETALALARQKSSQRNIAARFAAADSLHLDRLRETFETVLDCGLFHTFNPAERAAYIAGLASVTRPGSTLFILCFSDQGPETGPHPVRRDDLRTAFSAAAGWTVLSIEPDRIHTRFHSNGVPAWLATVRRA